jgi:hypothetical protein
MGGEQCTSCVPASRHRHLVLSERCPCTDEPLLHVPCFVRCSLSLIIARRTLRDVELATTVTSLRATAGCCSTRESDFRYDRAATPPENGHVRRREYHVRRVCIGRPAIVCSVRVNFAYSSLFFFFFSRKLDRSIASSVTRVGAGSVIL